MRNMESEKLNRILSEKYEPELIGGYIGYKKRSGDKRIRVYTRKEVECLEGSIIIPYEVKIKLINIYESKIYDIDISDIFEIL